MEEQNCRQSEQVEDKAVLENMQLNLFAYTSTVLLCRTLSVTNKRKNGFLNSYEIISLSVGTFLINNKLGENTDFFSNIL